MTATTSMLDRVLMLEPLPDHRVRDDGSYRVDCLSCGGPLALEFTSDGDFETCVQGCSKTDVLNALDPGPPTYLAGDVDSAQADSAVTADARVVTLEEFAAVEEPGAQPIVGEANRILIPEGADVMLYGTGGAGKTTLSVDLAFHLAAGEAWLGIPVPAPRRVLMIEAEGPRPLFRQKLRERLAAWKSAPIAGRIRVFEEPWARFSFAADAWRAALADLVDEHEVDVLIAGPLVRLGMDGPGTLQEVRDFMALVGDVRARCARSLTVLLVHHENRAGTVSGAWEGAGDTLLHVQAAGNGHTVVVVQKARWDSERHGRTLHLGWGDGGSFHLEGDRSYFAEIEELLADGKWRTAKQIAAPESEGGIGAGEAAVKAILNEHPESFASRTGDEARALGRHPSATLWQVRSASNAPDAPCAFSGGVEDAAALRPPLKGAAATEGTPGEAVNGALNGSGHLTQPAADDELGRLASKFPDMAQS